MNETNKCCNHRLALGDFQRWLRGTGLDIGSGADPLVVPDGSVRAWDMQDGDAEELASLADDQFHFVYSSHCLEHMRDVARALRNWVRVVAPGGVVYIVVPEWTLYEHRQWPSLHNADHKASFGVIACERPRDHPHYTVGDISRLALQAGAMLVETRLDMEGFDWIQHRLEPPFCDQTLGEGMAQALFVLRKL